MSYEETCGAEVWGDWNLHRCGRPVKRNGKCGIHARVEEERNRKRDEHREAKAAANVIVQRLGRHGVNAFAKYDGSVTLVTTAAQLADLLDAPTHPADADVVETAADERESDEKP